MRRRLRLRPLLLLMLAGCLPQPSCNVNICDVDGGVSYAATAADLQPCATVGEEQLVNGQQCICHQNFFDFCSSGGGTWSCEPDHDLSVPDDLAELDSATNTGD